MKETLIFFFCFSLTSCCVFFKKLSLQAVCLKFKCPPDNSHIFKQNIELMVI